MSRPSMLRTRRRDVNLKPNRRDARLSRLDRKSSRGMLYENEELRLKTININAEVESRQSDIKKLKRENEMLKKGLWYLRDEYDKLERLIKDKKIDFSSSSTTCTSSSDSDSCSSCSDDSEEVETTQNMKNDQRTNMTLKDRFDHLSVVTEETSAENSEPNSNGAQFISEAWDNFENDNVIKPDQSYPAYTNQRLCQPHTISTQAKVSQNFFTPIKPSNSQEQVHQVEGVLYPSEVYDDFISPVGNIQDVQEFQNTESLQSDQTYFKQHEVPYHNFTSKTIASSNATSFYQNMVPVPKSTEPQAETEPLEKSAADLIVKIDNQNFNNGLVFSNTTPSHSTFSNGGNLEELLHDIESISQRGANDQQRLSVARNEENQEEKPYKSELNVVLMPNPMPLIGFDKYREIKRSFESVNAKQPDDTMSMSQPELRFIPPAPPFPQAQSPGLQAQSPEIAECEAEQNPFFFGHFKDNYVSSDYFNMRYNPETFDIKEEQKETVSSVQKSSSKTNLIELTSSEHVSSENEENLRFRAPRPGPSDDKEHQKTDPQNPLGKLPKLTLRKKVSIHFKGKKDKTKKQSTESSDTSTTKTEKKQPFDVKFAEKEKEKTTKATSASHQKTPSIESRKSTTENANQEPKTPPTSSSSGEKRIGEAERSKGRKSTSVSPERSKHVHLKEEGGGKRHKKHKKSDRNRVRRGSYLMEPPGRSFSVCTDRSNTMAAGIGFGSGLFFDEGSERERTNSNSSVDLSDNARKMSTVSNIPLSGKVPWCGCWGNGCL
ncbi:unnamed protein product [Acanthoscelides obtectus]|uniref:Uncharacterized protein n=1 Tax=Acanthoscelides obtectus TaxID=200917 RepID=A0A9P0M572_ACAOB|nr:unnamed protein product [Acanthoscelides obtectus]CAK1665098.1 hypothetical protein AOBTE_LOCUS24656 [Acanthoscelides obtectus]